MSAYLYKLKCQLIAVQHANAYIWKHVLNMYPIIFPFQGLVVDIHSPKIPPHHQFIGSNLMDARHLNCELNDSLGV